MRINNWEEQILDDENNFEAGRRHLQFNQMGYYYALDLFNETRDNATYNNYIHREAGEQYYIDPLLGVGNASQELKFAVGT